MTSTAPEATTDATSDATSDAAAADGTGSGRRHTEHGRERKQQLLDAAADLFAERGYGATRIADICRAAGVAKGLFYWYFPTKGDLFVELVRTMRLGLRRAQAAAMDADADVVERIAQGTEASVRFMADHAAYFALIDVERADPAHAAVLNEGSDIYLDDVRRLIEEGQREGAFPDADPTLMAVGVLGAVSSFSNAYRNGRLDPDLSVEQLADFVRGWVASALG